MINKIKKLFVVSYGFSLLETLIAVLLLTTAIAGPLTIASKGIQATTLAKNQHTALYLAQDGLEYVRYVRDTNKLRGSSWLAGLDGTSNLFLSSDNVNGECIPTGGSVGCYLDSTGNSVSGSFNIASCGATCPIINYNGTNNRYSYTAGTQTPFTRLIVLVATVSGGGTEYNVKVQVSWTDQSTVVHTVILRENIYDWQ